MGVGAAIIGSAILGAVASNESARRQAEAAENAQKKATEAQMKAQQEAQAQAQALERQQDIDAQTSEKAKTEYGVDKKVKSMVSNDLIIPSSFEQSMGTSSKRTGLGF